MKNYIYYMTIVLFSHLNVTLHSEVPRILPYQGVLTDTSGNIKPDGIYNITFRLYNAPTAGAELWTETQSIQATDGLIYAQLGSINPIGSDLLFDNPY